jgi:hypothetical protein
VSEKKWRIVLADDSNQRHEIDVDTRETVPYFWIASTTFRCERFGDGLEISGYDAGRAVARVADAIAERFGIPMREIVGPDDVSRTEFRDREFDRSCQSNRLLVAEVTRLRALEAVFVSHVNACGDKALHEEVSSLVRKPRLRVASMLRAMHEAPPMFGSHTEMVAFAEGALGVLCDDGGNASNAIVLALWSVMHWDKAAPPKWDELPTETVLKVIDAAALRVGITMEER